MKESELFEVSIAQVGEEFIDTDLMNALGEVLNKAKVSVGTVHFTLAYMIAVDIGEGPKTNSDVAVGVLSIQQFIYGTAMAAFQAERKKGAH